MAITNFIPELWNAAVQVPFEKTLVFGQPSVANRKYEGQIKQQGDTVNITTIGDPTIKTYDKTTDIEVEDLTDGTLKLVIDQGDYFAFRVNDVDAVQAAGDFRSPATSRAAYGLKDKVDTFIASLFNLTVANGGPATANRLGDVNVINGTGTGKPGDGQTTAFNVLVGLNEKLNKQNVPTDGRYVIVPPEFLSALLQDPRFTRVDASGTAEGLRNGMVGRAIGFDILQSNNLPTASSKTLVVAGIPDALSFASQLTETEALRSQGRFADIVRGLNVYGAKITRPEGLATANCAFVAGTGVDTVVTTAGA
jgi:hypothetical protein